MFSILYYKIVMNEYHIDKLWQHMILLFEVITIGNMIMTVLQLGFFFALFASSPTLLKAFQLRDYDRTLLMVVKYCKQLTRMLINDVRMNPKTVKTFVLDRSIHNFLNWFILEHGRICVVTMKAWRGQFIKSFLIYFIISIPWNVLCVTTLILNETLTGSDEFFIYSLTIFHSSLTISLLEALAIQSNSLHRPAKHLIPIIQGINGKNSICMKTKYEDLYSRLICGPRYGPRLAMIGAITHLVIFNVCTSEWLTNCFLFLISKFHSIFFYPPVNIDDWHVYWMFYIRI